MEQQYLIDSNVVIDYLAGRLPIGGMNRLNEIVDRVPFLSVITKIEVLSFPSNPNSESLLSRFINQSFVIELTDEIVSETINIRRQAKVKTPDAIIAATAKVFELTLLTRNVGDFKSISSLRLLNPWEITA